MNENSPSLWQSVFPKPTVDSHKYTRGHTLIIGGDKAHTGASKLAAYGALRAGSGLVSIACDEASLAIYAASFMSIMTKPCQNPTDLEALLDDIRINAALIGPGCGVGNQTRSRTLRILAHKKSCVIDADAITAFEDSANMLFSAIQSPTVITPHEAEFSRLFSIQGAPEERVLASAQKSNAVIVLKGHHTLIASPDGKIIKNTTAPVWLATAGSGDVLAGLIAGLLAQGMPAFEAACASVWIHSRAANLLGAGLISEDLPSMVPAVLKELYG